MALAVVLLVGFEAQTKVEKPIERSRVPARVGALAMLGIESSNSVSQRR
jgi:hypothetical protein